MPVLPVFKANMACERMLLKNLRASSGNRSVRQSMPFVARCGQTLKASSVERVELCGAADVALVRHRRVDVWLMTPRTSQRHAVGWTRQCFGQSPSHRLVLQLCASASDRPSAEIPVEDSGLQS